ncbi:hypothetical protein EOD39_12769 [Acipenser ruthenus]|uniref:Uncharacterized protein n=1 Tax=Acipenser ruthenus TaxID=7906 RepID=A0A444UKC6_ACIRT|nr:hypothetical protein EOD39_12769 [Acipenser ruthenus]
MRKEEVPEDVWKEAEMKVESQDGSTTAVYHGMDVLWAFLSTAVDLKQTRTGGPHNLQYVRPLVNMEFPTT